MELFTSILIAFLTFSLGIISASYGAQIGKSIETRKEILEKMRDWIDIVLLHTNSEYQKELLGKSPIDEQKMNELRVKRLAENIRWIAIAEGLRSKPLVMAMENFINAVKHFDTPNNFSETIDKRQKYQFETIAKVEAAAQQLHITITHESVRVPFWLIPVYERTTSNPKWKITLWILSFVIFVIIISYVIFIR